MIRLLLKDADVQTSPGVLLENEFGRLADNVAPLRGVCETRHIGRSTEYEVLAVIVK
jgi:hypothetical protein